MKKKITGKNILLFTLVLCFTAFLVSSKKIHPVDSKKIEIRGIYGSPEPFWKKNLQLNNWV